MIDLARWCLETATQGTPVLGICFGFQLLGEALGGHVACNPAGPEDGSLGVQLTPEGRRDPLFEGLPDRLVVHQRHSDTLVRGPTDPGVVHLASSGPAPWQAFGWGPNLRAVQFHPEMTAARLETIMAAWQIRGGQTLPSPAAPGVLKNWVRHWITGRSARSLAH
jgi:GMP synthase (glutamine-hydrolysing)